MTPRILIGAVGALAMAYGALLLLTRQDLDQLVEVLVWLGAGVVAHDIMLTAAVLLLGVASRRFLADAWRAPATVALVVWGSLTVVVVPTLGRFGARADNPTLLDRPYLASWLVLSVLTVAAVAVAGAVRSRTPAIGSDRRR